MFIILILQAIVKMSTTTNQPTLTTPREFKCICGSGKHFFDCNHNNTIETGIRILSKEQLLQILNEVKKMCEINNICFYHWLKKNVRN